MKLPKAIELLTRPLNGDTTDTFFDLHDAQKLGAEALRAIQKWREDGDDDILERLPGEDEPE